MIKLPRRPKKIHRNNPKLILMDSIPRPLSGVNPRSIKGRTWWDKTRKQAYKYNNYYCHACGVYKLDAKIFQRLEAHEKYVIDYLNYRMKFIGVTALCHCCHAVIHAGRTTKLYLDNKLDENKFNAIAKHGKEMMKKYKMRPNNAFRYMELIYDGLYPEEAQEIINKEYNSENKYIDMNNWSSWRLVFEGRLYEPKFKSLEQWTKYYAKF